MVDEVSDQQQVGQGVVHGAEGLHGEEFVEQGGVDERAGFGEGEGFDEAGSVAVTHSQTESSGEDDHLPP